MRRPVKCGVFYETVAKIGHPNFVVGLDLGHPSTRPHPPYFLSASATGSGRFIALASCNCLELPSLSPDFSSASA